MRSRADASRPRPSTSVRPRLSLSELVDWPSVQSKSSSSTLYKGNWKKKGLSGYKLVNRTATQQEEAVTKKGRARSVRPAGSFKDLTSCLEGLDRLIKGEISEQEQRALAELRRRQGQAQSQARGPVELGQVRFREYSVLQDERMLAQLNEGTGVQAIMRGVNAAKEVRLARARRILADNSIRPVKGDRPQFLLGSRQSSFASQDHSG
jgi:hypothetical protein